MNYEEACKILGVDENSTTKEIKTKYRNLIREAHPDSMSDKGIKIPYNAQEINEAYDVVSKHRPSLKKASDIKRANGKENDRNKKAPVWKADVNPNAYVERDIYHQVEDIDGNSIAAVIVGTGKYYWSLDEEFPCFLKSIYECSKRLLDEIDNSMVDAESEYPYHKEVNEDYRLRHQAELTYLLASQFINTISTLKNLAKETVTETGSIFYVQAMVELENGYTSLTPGSFLWPMGIKNHKLILKAENGKRVGYLSFADDRLYYVLIPLFEQKVVQIKTVVSGKRDNMSRHKASGKVRKYADVELWIKMDNSKMVTYPDSITLKIEALLEAYKRSREE